MSEPKKWATIWSMDDMIYSIHFFTDGVLVKHRIFDWNELKANALLTTIVLLLQIFLKLRNQILDFQKSLPIEREYFNNNSPSIMSKIAITATLQWMSTSFYIHWLSYVSLRMSSRLSFIVFGTTAANSIPEIFKIFLLTFQIEGLILN